ncbi:MAG: DUF3798 domain-containing protein [Synergistaceae bacterium]|nr:DUF3798 domain-containing protein [Synergistaceae bacterium]MBQ6910383.1 DUF3798 domain-containing protein [Synergistaceae bacterium]MBQ7569691.1 DUF3798 domain-containing protein [Synergistaceae bacterium]MBQ9582132.1 DUF3798 domain-containing protein [Synergistaceae bacterium]MBQ9895878.1 DUF3798 domain-containing protein [Synergistaceae bacterium]
MKKFILALLVCSLFVSVAFAEDAKFHIGIVTGTVSQSEDDLRGAELMIARYGDTAKGGMITHLTYPDNFTSEAETTISQIAGLADDPLMKVIVVNQAIPGTTEGFRKVREKRPDILLFAGQPHEDPAIITAASDLAIMVDNISRGYLIPLGAKKLGSKTFVHVSFPRHMSMEVLGRRRVIMEEACKDLGIKFVFETAPDPTGDVGVAGAQQYILESMPTWIEKYGKDASFFATNDAHVEPMLRQIVKYGGIFVEASLPSPVMGYPGALGIDLSKESGNWPAILKKVEDVIVAQGGAERLGTWAYSYGYTNSAALAEFGKRIVEGNAKVDSMKDLIACYNEFTPGAGWNASYYTDAGTGVRNRKMVMVYQDTYIFGKGYLGLTGEEVPEKYYGIK